MEEMTIRIPDWAKKHNLFLFHGMELVAVKRPTGEWVLKDNRCSRCGSCCADRHLGNLPMPRNEQGFCMFLSHEDGKPFCSWKQARPFACCIGEPKFEPNCTVTWRHMYDVESPEDQRAE